VGQKRRRAKSNGPDSASRRPPTSPELSPRHSGSELFFAGTLFISAALLFVVEPMFAKMVLPLLGGAPAVWNTCLVFYQAVLLAGYLYAHFSLKWLGPRRQAVLHLALLCLPWTVLPIGVARGWVPSPESFPVGWLWMLLTVSVGLPFLVVSASAPTLQAWFSQTGGRSARDPYFLYAASNLGSLLALLGYPLVIESHLTLREQSWGWTAGYGLLMLLVAGCAVQLRWSPPVEPAIEGSPGAVPVETAAAARPSWRRRLWWLALSLVPSSLLLGVTTYISTDIAAIPLLWVIPLALYLLTFVLVFARRTILPLRWMLRVEPYLIVAAAGALAWHANLPIQLLAIGSLQLLAFFVIAMVCHGQLAADRPAGSHLTEFYLWMSLGGVLGGLFNALVAPLLFSGAVEYPLMIAAACLLRPPAPAARATAWVWMRRFALPGVVLAACCGLSWIARRQDVADLRYFDFALPKLILVLSAAAAAFALRRRPVPFGLAVAAVLGISWLCSSGEGRLLYAGRSFFGVLRVTDDRFWNAHQLSHGSTAHGSQGLDPRERRQPWAYYHPDGPLGQVFRGLAARRPLAEIGVLGLGAGAIAAYGQPGERITFYEIDPDVEHIARDPRYFTYLSDCPAKVEVVLGDARLSLANGPPRKFDLLVVDVFSSDSVPTHLATREAFQLYLSRLADHGLLAVHASSRFLDLRPILGRLAKDAGLTGRIYDDPGEQLGPRRLPSTWAVMARRPEDLAALPDDPRAKPLAVDNGRVWTDDFSNLVEAIQWRSSWQQLQPAAWWKSAANEAAFCNALGIVLGKQGRVDEAIEQFRNAVRIDPGLADAHSNLALALQKAGRLDEALAECREALRLNPDFAEGHYNLGCVLFQKSEVEEALHQFQEALRIRPDYGEARYNLNVAFSHWGQVRNALAEQREALRKRPQDAALLRALAWTLATNPNVSIRNGREAVDLADRSVRLSQGKQPEPLDALAAAYAEAGRFADAVETARQALAIAQREKNPTLAKAIEARLRLYKAGAPYRDQP
jgi:tetratricopeptide (TPR) repeat protein